MIKQFFDQAYQDIKTIKSTNKVDYTNRLVKALSIPEFSIAYEEREKISMQIEKNTKLGVDNSSLICKKKAQAKILLDLIKSHNLDLTMHYSCPKCKDNGVVNNKYCSCVIDRYIEYLKDNSNIYPKYKTASLESMPQDANLYPQMEVFNVITNILNKTLFNNFNNDKPLVFLLSGDVGVGKTYYASAVANKLMDKAISSAYISSNELAENIVNKQFNKKYNTSIYNYLFETECLIIDDLGTENNINSITLPAILSIVDSRINNNLVTFITTNVKIDNISKIYGERLASRLLDNNYSICPKYITGKNFRSK